MNDDIEKGIQPSEQQVPVQKDVQDAQADPATEKTDTTTPSSTGPPAPGPPPDGGLQAWMVVVGAFCGLFVSFGWINCKFCCMSSRRSTLIHP